MDRIHHVAIFTADYGAFAAFWREVFAAELADECTQPSVVRVGGATFHVFESEAGRSSFSPAHLHHFALETGDLDEFVAVRERMLARGACQEEVTDFGDHLSLIGADPDGGMLEVLVAVEDREALPFPVVAH